MTKRTSSRRAKGWQRSAHKSRLPHAAYRRPLRLEPLEDRRLLAVVTVTTNLDTVDFNDGKLSLREAIFATNLVSGADEIRFDFGHDGPEKIVLTQGELQIADHVTINGPGAEWLIIDGQLQSRVFNIDDAKESSQLDVEIIGVTMTRGRSDYSGGAVRNAENLLVRDSTISGSVTLGRGGAGIYSLGNLAVEYCQIVDNHVDMSHGGQNAKGGGISSFGAVTIENSLIANNSGWRGGGVQAGELTIRWSQVVDNSAYEGGGISAGRAEITDSTISRNAATGVNSRVGGGGLLLTGISNIARSTISSNTSKTYGGGVTNSRIGQDLVITDSTISGNSAAKHGGGIHFPTANLSLIRSTVTNNVAEEFGGGVMLRGAGTLNASHSIISGNAGAVMSDDLSPAYIDTRDFYAFQAPTLRYTIVGQGEGTHLPEAPVGSPDANGNLIGGSVHGIIDARLAPIADNGGPTQTHALLPDSPAINAGNLNAQSGASGVPEFDQRGMPFDRIVGGRIDIGAFEYQTPTDLNLLVDTLEDESDGDYSRGDLSLREAIEIANLWLGLDTIRFDPALTATGPASIVLTHGNLHISDHLSILGPGSELLTIDASGNDPTPEENNGDGSCIVRVSYSYLDVINFDIAGLTLTGSDTYGLAAVNSTASGRVTITDCDIVENADARIFNTAIGGVFAAGDLIIERSLISGNIGTGVHAGRRVTLNDSLVSNNTRAGIVSWLGETTLNRSTVSGNLGGGIVAGIAGGVGTRGPVILDDSLITGNSTTGYGGGIYSFGAVTLNRSTVSGNSATGDGGGIFTRRQVPNPFAPEGTVVLNDSDVSDNTSQNRGGGIASGNITLNHSTVDNNTAANEGGGLFTGGPLDVRFSTVSRNSAGGDGGGLYCVNANVNIYDSTIRDNTTDGNGGGVAAMKLRLQRTTISGNRANNNGGGIWARAFAIGDSTVSGNSAGGSGGGLWSMGSAGLVRCTVTANVAAASGGGVFVEQDSLSLSHTIVAANTAPVGRDLTGLIGLMIHPEFSLIGSNANTGLAAARNAPSADGNYIGGPTLGQRIDPRLGPLADNGGPTLTHALLSNSLARDSGDPSLQLPDDLPFHDQRGAPFIRVYGGRIDIGAVEWLPAGFLPGDFNHDSRVDALDYTVWRNAINTDLRPDPIADGDGDTNVSNLEFDIWRNNYGSTSDDLPSPPVGSLLFAAAENVVAHSNSNSADQQILATEGDVAPRSIHRAATGRFARSSTSTEQRDAALLAWISRDFDADDQLADSNGSRTHCDESNDPDDALELAFAELGGVR